ncbi:MAG: hypothetical protein ACK5N1_01635 [Gemmatimonas sp.]
MRSRTSSHPRHLSALGGWALVAATMMAAPESFPLAPDVAAAAGHTAPARLAGWRHVAGHAVLAGYTVLADSASTVRTAPNAAPMASECSRRAVGAVAVGTMTGGT